MLIFPHAVAGAVIGENIGSDFLAFGLGFLSHFVLDAIPHFDTTDEGRWTKRQIALAVADLGIGVVVLWYFLPEINQSGYFWGIFGAILPDLMDNVPFWSEKFRETRAGSVFHKIHGGIQRDIKIPFWGY